MAGRLRPGVRTLPLLNPLLYDTAFKYFRLGDASVMAVFVFASLLLVTPICVFFPFFWMAVTAIKTVPEIQRVPLTIAPDRWTNLDNFREVSIASRSGASSATAP